MWQNHLIEENERQKNPKGQSRIDNPEKLATQTQDEDKHSKKHNTICAG